MTRGHTSRKNAPAIAALLSVALAGTLGASEPTPLELFEQRILPIFKSPEPSSCIQCHLSSVDLKEYILPSHEDTFASLREQGLIDLEKPSRSKILQLIEMGEKDRDEGAQRIHATRRAAELEAFSVWIEACCADERLRKLPAPSASRAGPKRADAIIRHTRKSRVLDSFVRSIWSQRMRCFPCHTPHEIDAKNPRHEKAIERLAEFEENFGTEVARRLRIFKATPEETLDFLVESSRETPADRLPLINLRHPRKSLLLLKPTAKLPAKIDGVRTPSYVEPVSHMGGLKIHVDDQSYKSFVAWLEDYARVVGGRYRNVDELPADNWYPSKHVIMLREAPEDWPDFSRVQLFVHAWDAEEGAWREEPVAFTQNSVTPRRSVAGALFLLRPRGETAARDWGPEAARLAAGKYLVRAHVDRERRLHDKPTIFLGEKTFAGQVEIDARWREGFKNAQRIRGSQLKRPE